MHPVTGILSSAEKGPASAINLEIEGLQEPVDVYYNERGVPHIFAQNDHDLYYAQGFITARDRLFQLEVTVRGAEGALSEWLGDRMLNYDRNMRRIGMVYGAEKALEGMQNSDTYALLQAYSDGINAWINQLSEEDYPVEYKLLGVSPREWEPLYTAIFLKYMTRTLAGGSSDLSTANTAAHFREEFVDRYLAGRSEWMDPIISPEHVWNFDARIPASPSTPFTPSITQHIEPYTVDPGIGSNNWAISPDRTVNGRPLLAGDPHLNLSMPSIWYEMQLNAPGVNVYGVTLPGSPSVIMG
ncbi:MAG: penicillin acylase family protein, partial [Balneolaceae bacterium]